MQGMKFLIVGKDGPTNHGVIAQRITADRYLCSFAKTPAISRVVSLDEIMGALIVDGASGPWCLFPDDEQMNAFIIALQQANPPPNKPAASKKTSKKKKKVTKKKGKRNGKE